MTSRVDRFFVALTLLYVFGFSAAIYDPREATTKPPKRREPVLPWYLSGTPVKDYIDSSEDSNSPRSPKWQTDPDNPAPRKPIIVDSGTKTWSTWRKNPGSEIEQRTEILTERTPGVNQQEGVDQHVDESFDYNQFEERENRRLSTKPGFETRKEDKGFEKPGENQVQTNVKDERDFYEGVPIDSTKPQKEKIVHSTKLKSTVARYDSQLGVQCPDFESTGQFVYPPDCKFFVNCWKGRAFVQPCAPGTLFNPNTLECDFPHKVKCYGGELADFPSSHHLDSTGRREPLITGSHSHLEHERVQVAKCPPHVTGLLPHPTDCTKFLQCANGGTFVMDCGPGTVFNSAISVCDWPRNVRGCEDSLKPNEGNGKPLTPPNPHEHFDNKRLEYNNRPSVKKIACPSDFNGLLPHPDTCKKFLQCANGATFVMDCGPGTAFNPLTSVCDWPHKVPGCSENKSFTHPSINAITTAKPWPSRDSTAGRQWQSPQRYNETSPGNKPGPWPPRYNPPVTTTNPPETNWDALRPTWRPSWKPNPPTTTNPPYHRDSQDRYGHHGYYEHHESDRHKEHGRWESTGGSDHYPNRDNDGDHSTGGWEYGHRTNDRDYHQHGGENVEDSYNHHYHHHEHHHGRYPQRTYEVDDDQQPYGHPQRPPGDNQGRPDEGWHHDHHYHHQPINHGRPWNYPVPNYPDESHDFDKQVPQNPYQPDDQGSIPDRGYGGNSFDRPPTRDSTVSHDDNVQTNRRTGYEYTPNRQEYGRTSPEFNRPRFNQTPASDGNVYVDNDYGLSGNRNIDSSRNVSSWSVGGNRTVVWPAWNRTRWSAPVIPGGQGFHPSTGPGQQGQGPLPSQPQNRQWDQGTLNEEDKLREWGSRTNIYQQSTIDREADSKLDQWALRTNVFQQGKESAQTGGKSTTQVTTSPLYPNGVYVNVNGTRGHFITKEIEINQGHSNTKTYKPNGLQESNYTNAKNDGTDYHRPILPPTNLQPPYYEPPNRPRISPTLTQLPSVDTYYPPVPATNLQPPYQPSHLGSLNSTKWPTLDNQYPAVPATDLLPPYYQPPSRSQISPNSTKPRIENKYPVPSRDLQPPYYDPPSSPLDSPPFNKSSATGNKYPAVPSRHLQPPFYEPPSRPLDYPSSNDSSVSVNQYPAVPASNLQPPFYEPPSRPLDYKSSNDSSVPVNQYPAVPASNLQPPHYQHPNYLSTSSNATALPRTANQPSVVPPSDLQPPHSADTSTNFSRPIDLAGSDSNYMFTVPNVTHKVPDMYLIVPTRKKDHETTTEKAPTTIVTTTDPNIPSVSIEYEEHPSVTTFTEVEPEPDIDYDVDVLDDKEVWKPVLVFENKTKTTTESSVIMKINKKKVDVDLFNLEAPPFQDEEPPFPAYYVPPVEPISHSKKTALLTPISGQVIRLRGGSGPHDGYVEVQGVNPGWGIVCDSRNSWTLKKAHLVCKQLGYSRGAEMAWQGRNNRNGVPTWIAANSVTCHGNETRFQSCKFTHEHQCRVERDAIGVRCAQNRVAHCRKDEVPYEGQCYHLADPDSGLNHAEALDYCSRRDARLIDVISQLENDFVSEWLLQLHPEVGSIMTSGVGFTTLNRTFWLWEDASRAKFRFAKWWPGWLEDKKHPPFVGARPLCVIMKRKFPCHERPESTCVADYFFWDTEDCAASTKGHSYICKRPYDDIGCIYGKGNQYAGNANVTALGKECLPWSDEKVAHRLTVTVVNRDVREKLKTHNYCRNPNPNRESRPWCFAEPSGEREYCDIPPCGNIESKKLHLTGQCKPKHFECLPGECIPSPWVCDGEEDCTNGADEKACISHLNLFKKSARYKLEGYDVEKWLNTPLKTCALRCKEADFTCRSFVHKAVGNVCLLSDSNVGMTGSLKPNKEFDYYEMKERSINCDGMYVCGNGKCINQTQVCNGKNDCNDRTDENICTVENLDYAIRLAGSNSSYEGRVEVKILGVWGQVCDDGFGMINADVICKELGFVLGALEVRPGGFYGNLDPPTRFMVDQLKCRGNESSLRECDFDGWGVHNCQPEEAVGVICKTAVDSCQEGHWKCDNSPTCIPMPFICDEVVDCPDGSDESPSHCDAPFEIRLANGSSSLKGRVEVRHHGIWGTVCDDDFSNATAAVICRSLGYGGIAIAKKNGFFGAGEGPIWLDEVFCHGNETQLNRCEHNYWGQHNCDHNEDAGVICTPGDVNDSKLHWENVPDLPQPNANDLLPANCGKRFKDFNDDEDLIFAKVVHGSIAQKGTYPWQASIRVRGHSRSSHWCGAVILSPLHVLTAAHCLEGYNKGTYFVRAGDYNTEIDEGTEAEANIEDYYVHEDFRKGHRMNNDIALVLLKGRGIPLGKDIMPICLPSENAEYPAGLNCTISGFGSIETGKSTHSKDLRYGWIPLLDQSVCRAGHVYGEGAISDGMVCAGYLDEGVDTCDGDSGGPLACYHNGAFTLYGITSWGQHCGKANKPGVYVRVSYYRRWIDLKVRESLAGR